MKEDRFIRSNALNKQISQPLEETMQLQTPMELILKTLFKLTVLVFIRLGQEFLGIANGVLSQQARQPTFAQHILYLTVWQYIGL